MPQVSQIAVETVLAGPKEPLYTYRDRGDDAFYTSWQSADFLTDRGYPIKRRYFGKIAAPGSGIGPRPDRKFGGRNLWRGHTLLAWARTRSLEGEAAA
jgi:hypothetical protein